ALSRVANHPLALICAGRTDTGVHGLAQVAHCDMARDWRPFRLGEALSYHLKPQPIAITDCVLAPENFHARFSALERRYHFRILSRRAPAVHQAGLVWQIKHGLDVEAMQAAADLLVGKHDFTTFRSTVCQAESPVKTLDRLQVSQVETMAGTEYHFDVRARSFLHNQVRSFVGSLERVGAGSWSVADMGTALAAKDRAACGPVCPPQGLYLAHVSYPVDPFAKA
ncbi:MAG TPA: tRNA pseudouridine(38-40) synthase TruA, partial [Sulfitobacter sp.]|nr:tRNA pseudouridine(38-40) synthase TruA [Sulfitobacter sp.]